MSKMIHSMIRVLDEARSVQFYKDAFDLSIKDRFDFDDFTLIYMVGEGTSFELELTINKGRDTPYDLGDGYGHIAFAVSDIDALHKEMTDKGFEPRKIVEFHRDGALFAKFFFVADPDGYQIEVLQRHGRFQ